MTKEARFVLSGFFRLTDHDKLEVSQMIERYMTAAIPLRQEIVERVSVVFHPPPFGCLICEPERLRPERSDQRSRRPDHK